MRPEHVGRYEVKAELGRGGMAAVYQAYDPRFKRDVAVKVLPAELLHDPAFHARFIREAEIIASLEHPAIVPVHDFGEEAGQPYIVMRMMTGGTLADRLRQGPLSVQQTARLLAALALALDRAHAKGIIHRDLKPSNILFDSDDNPYLSDFGIAKLAEAGTAVTGTGVIGTPAYMSPEQARGDRDLDSRSDLYALGAVVYEMLTGRQPYEAETPMGQAVKHITEPVPDILTVQPDLPAAAATFIEKAMAKSRDARYGTAGELSDGLAMLAPVTPPARRPAAATAPTEGPTAVRRPALAYAERTEKFTPAETRAATSEGPRAARAPRWMWGTLGAIGAAAVCLVAVLATAESLRNNVPTSPSPAPPSTRAPVDPTEAPSTRAQVDPTEAPIIAATVPLAPPAFECTDELGCLTIAPGEPIHLAWALVVSGENAALGIDVRRGVELALDDQGSAILNHPIELTGEDTGCSAAGGLAAAQRLAADMTIAAIIGTSCSSEARVAGPILSDNGFTLVSASNTAPDLTDPATHVAGFLRIAHNDKVEGAVAAEFAFNRLGVTKAATIHDGSPYAEGLVEVFTQMFVELGGEIVAQEEIKPGDTDMHTPLTNIAAAGSELIFYPIFVAEGGFVTAQARATPGLETVVLLGADGMFTPKFLEAAGAAAEGMYHASPDFSAFTGGYAAFLDKYQVKYGESPIAAYHTHAYDAANIIFAAIEKVAVQAADGTLHIGRAALRTALFATKDFAGLTGNITCNADGDCADPHIAVYQTVNADAAAWNPGAESDSNPKKIYP